MAVDLPGISRADAAEFFARLRFIEKLDGALLIRAEVAGERPSGTAAVITPEEVVEHIGLTVPVRPLSRAAWLKKMNHSQNDDLNRSKSRVEELLGSEKVS